MAEAKTIEVKEVPKSDLSRIFNRVDVVKESPSHIYGDSVQVEDMAVFSISPADPVTRDELKEIELGWTVQQAMLADMNNVPIVAIGGDWFPDAIEEPKKPRKNATDKKQREYLDALAVVKEQYENTKKIVERVSMSRVQYKAGIDASITSADTRALLAKCIKVENYKEVVLKDGVEVLEVTKKNNAEIVATMPDIFVLWCYNKVRNISNLTQGEVLGL